MKEHPILFSGAMVRAILDGRKTETRRVIKHQLKEAGSYLGEPMFIWDHLRFFCHTSLAYMKPLMLPLCPYGVPGDHLWVRETWAMNDPPSGVTFRADGEAHNGFPEKWRPSIFLPRRYSRITLEVSEVRVERVQDISEADAIAEGIRRALVHPPGRIEPVHPPHGINPFPPGAYGYATGLEPFPDHSFLWPTAREAYRELWDSINLKRGFGWKANPWVWAISFRRVD